MQNENLDYETKQRQIANLQLEGGKGRIEDLALYFTMIGSDEVELKAGGKEELVTTQNLGEYLELLADFVMQKGVQTQVRAFRRGVSKVLPVDFMSGFSAEELEDIVCGNSDQSEWNVENLREHLTPTHGYH